MRFPKELAQYFGITSTDIVFVNPKKVMIRYEDELDDTIRENVRTICVEEGPTGTAIAVCYRTEQGDGSVSTSADGIREIIVLD